MGSFISHRTSIAAGMAALFVIAASPPVSAQIGISTRLAGMSPDLAGIADDPVTDAVLSPARLGVFDRPQVYTGKLARVDWILRFPTFDTYPSGLELEIPPSGAVLHDHPLTYADPVVGALFTPIGDHMVGAISASIASYGYDRGEATTSVSPTTYPVDNGLTTGTRVYGSQLEVNLARVDAGLCTSRGADAHAWGFNVAVEYKTVDDNYTDSDMNTTLSIPDPTQTLDRQSLRKAIDETEQMSAEATLAVYRPGRTLRDASLTASVVRVTRDNLSLRQYITDEDPDGDGYDPDGGTPYYEYSTYDLGSDRTYTGAGGAARAVLAYGDRVRSVHTVSFLAMTGDGNADLSSTELERYSGANSGNMETLGYGYDGTVSCIDATSAVGLFEELVDRVHVGLVVWARYTREELDEDAAGDGAFTIVSGGSNTTLTSQFRQNVSVIRQTEKMRVSLAGEWEVSRYLTFRNGVAFQADHVKTDATATYGIDGLGTLTNLGNAVGGENRIDYATTTSFRTGVGIRLADRLFVDIQATALSYTSYSYGTVRFLF